MRAILLAAPLVLEPIEYGESFPSPPRTRKRIREQRVSAVVLPSGNPTLWKRSRSGCPVFVHGVAQGGVETEPTQRRLNRSQRIQSRQAFRDTAVRAEGSSDFGVCARRKRIVFHRAIRL